MRQALGTRTQDFRDAGRSKRQRLKEAHPGHAQPHWLEHGPIFGIRATQLDGQSARLTSIPPTLGSVLKQRLKIVLLDAIPIRQFSAVFGTGFGSVFPKLKC